MFVLHWCRVDFESKTMEKLLKEDRIYDKINLKILQFTTTGMTKKFASVIEKL